MTNLYVVSGSDHGEISLYKDDEDNTYFRSIESSGSIEKNDREYYNVYRQIHIWNDGDVTFLENKLRHEKVKLICETCEVVNNG